MMLTLFNPILSKKPALLFFSFKMKQTLNFRFFDQKVDQTEVKEFDKKNWVLLENL